MDLGVAPRTTTERHMLKIDWTMCSKYDNHSKLNNQHNFGGEELYNHFMST